MCAPTFVWFSHCFIYSSIKCSAWAWEWLCQCILFNKTKINDVFTFLPLHLRCSTLSSQCHHQRWPPLSLCVFNSKCRNHYDFLHAKCLAAVWAVWISLWTIECLHFVTIEKELVNKSTQPNSRNLKWLNTLCQRKYAQEIGWMTRTDMNGTYVVWKWIKTTTSFVVDCWT